MNEPRYQRRKQDRPQEITDAALAAFAEKGYAATRVDDVAKRAGVSKGLLYLYFKTKEELFKAVVRSFVVPRIDALTEVIDSSVTARNCPARSSCADPFSTSSRRCLARPSVW
jgi:AcrR family transcriptional regulator